MKKRGKKSRVMPVLSVALLLLLSGVPSPVSADRGGISLYPTADVLEPGQKAIIAWNGQEEILILSTDVKANQSTLILEFLPLPSNPKAIEKADFTSFVKLQEIIRKQTWNYAESRNVKTLGADNFAKSVVVTFHEKIGAHDITVVKAENASELAFWVGEFLSKINATTELSLQEYETIFKDYISRGFPYFALDLVEVSSSEKSVEPILYLFETDFLYYPLKISSLFSGDTSITLFLLTRQKFGCYMFYRSGTYIWTKSMVYVEKNQTKMYAPGEFTWSLGKVFQFSLTDEELRNIDMRLGSLFDGSAVLTVLEYTGPLDIFIGDLTLREDEDLLTYPFVSPIPFSTVKYEETPPAINRIKLIPSNLITNKTLEEITIIPSQEVTILVDYHSPVISPANHSILADGSVFIHSQVEDLMSGVGNVTLFYKITGGNWSSIRMSMADDRFVATVALEPYKNFSFYIEASDLAGNKALEDNDGIYYLVDVAYRTGGIILHNLSLIMACILAASLIAFIVKVYAERLLNHRL